VGAFGGLVNAADAWSSRRSAHRSWWEVLSKMAGSKASSSAWFRLDASETRPARRAPARHERTISCKPRRGGARRSRLPCRQSLEPASICDCNALVRFCAAFNC
jgi:hypothetical protein